MRHRCIWSNRQGDDLVGIRLPKTDALGRVVGERTAFVQQIHEQRARAFVEKAVRHGRLFLALILLGVMGLLGFGAAGWTVLAGASIVGMGITVLFLPFVTPQTMEMFGIRTSIVLARVAGLLLVAMGGVIASGVLGG
jgi:hypothetical protein